MELSAASTASANDRRPLLRPEEWIAIVYAAAIAALFLVLNYPLSIGAVGWEYAKFLIAILAVSLPLWLVRKLVDLRRGRPMLRGAAKDLAELLRGMASFWLVLVAYTHAKSRIASVNPRLFDELLRDLDSALHAAGGDLLRWTLSFTHDRQAAVAWSFVYLFAWAALALPFGVAFARGGAVAVRPILFALGLAYIGGSLLYFALPALGPGFAFRPEFTHLAGVPAYDVQDAMLRNYLYLATHPDARAIPFAGIAAFPSLHLATTAIGLFAAARWCRPLLYVLIPWNLAIAWSALYFGWHYAVDFHAGILLAWGSWWLARRLAGEVSRRAESV